MFNFAVGLDRESILTAKFSQSTVLIFSINIQLLEDEKGPCIYISVLLWKVDFLCHVPELSIILNQQERIRTGD